MAFIDGVFSGLCGERRMKVSFFSHFASNPSLARRILDGRRGEAAADAPFFFGVLPMAVGAGFAIK
jgi:hypothetical protein